MPRRPKIMGLGGGPILIDHSTSYADGLATTCPPVWATRYQTPPFSTSILLASRIMAVFVPDQLEQPIGNRLARLIRRDRNQLNFL